MSQNRTTVGIIELGITSFGSVGVVRAMISSAPKSYFPSLRPNQSMQPTAGRSDANLSS
jgi:hypothetical protein